VRRPGMGVGTIDFLTGERKEEGAAEEKEPPDFSFHLLLRFGWIVWPRRSPGKGKKKGGGNSEGVQGQPNGEREGKEGGKRSAGGGEKLCRYWPVLLLLSRLGGKKREEGRKGERGEDAKRSLARVRHFSVLSIGTSTDGKKEKGGGEGPERKGRKCESITQPGQSVVCKGGGGGGGRSLREGLG